MDIKLFIQELERISFLIKKSTEDGEEALNLLSIETGLTEEELKKLIKEGINDQNVSYN